MRTSTARWRPSCASRVPRARLVALGLPDRATLRGRPHHRRSVLAAECLLEFERIGERPDHTILRDRVRIVLHQFPLKLQALFGTPKLPPRDEELLLGAEAIDDRHLVMLHGPLEGEVRDTHTCEVPNRFAQDPLSLVMDPRLNRIPLVLIHHALANFFE